MTRGHSSIHSKLAILAHESNQIPKEQSINSNLTLSTSIETDLDTFLCDQLSLINNCTSTTTNSKLSRATGNSLSNSSGLVSHKITSTSTATLHFTVSGRGIYLFTKQSSEGPSASSLNSQQRVHLSLLSPSQRPLDRRLSIAARRVANSRKACCALVPDARSVAV